MYFLRFIQALLESNKYCYFFPYEDGNVDHPIGFMEEHKVMEAKEEKPRIAHMAQETFEMVGLLFSILIDPLPKYFYDLSLCIWFLNNRVRSR